MASSSFGFQPAFVYKIVCVKDRYSVAIADDSVEPGARVVTLKSKKTSSQKFKTEPVDDAPGEFRVSALLQPSDGTRLVWDSIPGVGLVIHNVRDDTTSGSPNQIWTTERVYPEKRNNKIFFIKTKDGLCLRNMGKGEQLKLVPKDVRDPYQHWILDPTTSY